MGHLVEKKQDTEKIHAKRWKALLFNKKGKSFRSLETFDSEEDVIDIAAKLKRAVKRWRDDPNKKRLGLNTMDGPILVEEYSHLIPIPWSK